jgi:hypothetical protein
MSKARLIRIIVIAGLLAVACIWGGLYGIALSLAAGTIGVILSHRFRKRMMLLQEQKKRELSEYKPWICGTACFALFVIAMWPLVDLPAVLLGLVLFSPLFGMAVYSIEALFTQRINGA